MILAIAMIMIGSACRIRMGIPIRISDRHAVTFVAIAMNVATRPASRGWLRPSLAA
jgi:hypothetical protein